MGPLCRAAVNGPTGSREETNMKKQCKGPKCLLPVLRGPGSFEYWLVSVNTIITIPVEMSFCAKGGSLRPWQGGLYVQRQFSIYPNPLCRIRNMTRSDQEKIKLYFFNIRVELKDDLLYTLECNL